MRIASWNVNSVRQRTAPLLDYLRDVAPDVLCLQELKCQDEAFPRAEVEDADNAVAVALLCALIEQTCLLYTSRCV